MNGRIARSSRLDRPRSQPQGAPAADPLWPRGDEVSSGVRNADAGLSLWGFAAVTHAIGSIARETRVEIFRGA